MPTWSKSLFLSALVISLAAAALFNALSSRPTAEIKKIEEKTLAVRAHTVSVATRHPLLFLIGKVEAPDYVILTAPVEAEILRLTVVAGDYFPAGHRLLKFDLREQHLLIEQQEAGNEEIRLQIAAISRDRLADNKRLADTRRLVEIARKNHERSKELFASGVVTRAVVEGDEQEYHSNHKELVALQNRINSYQTQKKVLTAQLKSAEARIEQTHILINRAKILAPFAGRVAKIQASRGQRALPGQTLMEIYDPARLRLRTALPQRFANFADKNLQALLPSAETTITATFSGLEPSITAGNSGLDVFFRLPKGDWILGATHKAEVQLAATENLVAVPPSAIYGDDRVYRINADNRVETQTCKRFGLGRENGELVELLRCPNLKDGDLIVASQQPILIDASAVRIVP